MKISEILASEKKPFPSIEIVPPSKGVSKNELIEMIKPFMAFNPPYVNVTCHRNEYEYTKANDGSLIRRTIKNTVSQTAVCAVVQDEFKVEVVPHMICGGAVEYDIQTDLYDFNFMGVSNILALRGDSIHGEERFTPETGGFRYASELVSAIRKFEAEHNGDFCIGVAGYPEKHFEAPDMKTDLMNLKKKVDAGADFIITQMFYDNDIFYRFRDLCIESGIRVPIIPGVMPLSSAKQTISFPSIFSLSIPLELSEKMKAEKDNPDVCYRIGTDWSCSQCEDLLKNGVPAIHFYTMGKQNNILDILKSLF